MRVLLWMLGVLFLVECQGTEVGKPFVQMGHTDYVESIAVSPNGKYFVSGGRDGLIKLWDMEKKKNIKTFKSSHFSVNKVNFSFDGKYIFAKNQNETQVWEIKSGKEIKSWKHIKIFKEHSKIIKSGKNIFSLIINKKTITLWDKKNRKKIKIFRGHTKKITTAIFSLDRKYIISGSEDNSIKIWSIKDKKEIISFKGQRINQMRATDKYIISHFNKYLIVKDFKTGRELKRLKGHINPIYGVTINQSNKYVASFCLDWEKQNNFILKLWDIEKGKELKRFKTYMFPSKNPFVYDEKYLVLVKPKDDSTPIFLDIKTGKEVELLKEIRTLKIEAFGSNKNYIALADTNHSVSLWDIKSKKKIKIFNGHLNKINNISISDDFKYIITVDNKLAKIWDIKSGKNIQNIQKYYSNHSFNNVSFSPNSKYFISYFLGYSIKLWDIKSGKNIKTFKGHSESIISAQFINNGKQIISSSWDGTIRLWDIKTGKELVSMISFRDGEWITITPDGYFDASKNGAKHLNILTDPLTVTSIDAYYEKFYRPDIVRKAMQGEVTHNLVKISDIKSPPSVKILNTEKEVDAENLTVVVKVTPKNGGVGDVRLYLNGTVVPATTTRSIRKQSSLKPFTKEFRVSLKEGINEIKATAFESTNSARSTFAILSVNSTQKSTYRPKLHALIVGIQEFENSKKNLKYTRADAKLFAQALKSGAEGLFDNGKMVILLTKEETTKANILKEFKTFKGLDSRDLFIFYAGSHGMVDDGMYYLISSNVGSVSSRRLPKDAISRDELKDAMSNIGTSKKMVILDTCFAGQYSKETTDENVATRGLTEEEALNVLSRAVGLNVFAASKSTQESLEGYKGHGLFTYVLVEGLKKEADQNRDGFVKTLELANYVDEVVPRISASEPFKHKQFPTINTSGQAFPLGRVE